MNKITTNKDKLEFECDLVYYEDGLKIANQLKNVILFGKHKNCVGLAHNQIGGNKKVFIAKIDNKWRTFINPKITFFEGKKFEHEESCMSFPNKSNKVIRWNKIELTHQVRARNDYNTNPNDNYGEMWKKELFFGFNAVIIQHEMDHLNGIHIFNKNKDNNNG